jgi:hypothetical protein
MHHNNSPELEPGDLSSIVCVPNAAPEQREAVIDALLNYARVLERIGARLPAEKPEAEPPSS